MKRAISSKDVNQYDISLANLERLITFRRRINDEVIPTPPPRRYQIQRKISFRDLYHHDLQVTATDRLITYGGDSASVPPPFVIDKTWWRKMLWETCTGLIGGEVCWQYEHWTKKYHCYTYVKPQPTVTAKVLAARDKFRQAMNAWKALTNKEREDWEEFYKYRNYTGKNKFVSKFILGLPLEIDKYQY